MDEVLLYIGIYIGVVNLAGFILMAIDKRKARRNKWRIPEATLFLFAIFGGSLGCILGMQLFRNKTLKPAFIIGMPVIFIIQVLIIIYILFLSPLSFKIL